MKKDFYTRLGVPVFANQDEIRAAYFEAARIFHPDVNPAETAAEDFLEIQEAYDALSDVNRREAYDHTRLDFLAPGPDIVIECEYSAASLARLDEPQRVYGLVKIETGGALRQKQPLKPPNVHLCLVLDRSTSMQGERMDMVKSGVMHLVKQMDPKDVLTVVAFSDRAEVILPPTPVERLDNSARQVGFMSASGATEIYQGVSRGAEALRMIPFRGLRMMLLVTDGHTYGDEENCIELARGLADEGISLYGVGIGEAWNDAFLDRLSAISGRSAVFVQRHEDLFAVFDGIKNTVQALYATDLRLDYVMSAGCQLSGVLRLDPECGFLEAATPIPLGNLRKDLPIRLLLEFVVPPEAVEKARGLTLLRGEVVMSVLGRDPSNARIRVRLERTVGAAEVNGEVSAAVLEAVSKLTLIRMQEKARQDVAAGRVKDATRRLEYIATNLLARGENGLAREALQEAQRLENNQSGDAAAEKRIKYGTRALVLPALKEGRRS